MTNKDNELVERIAEIIQDCPDLTVGQIAEEIYDNVIAALQSQQGSVSEAKLDAAITDCFMTWNSCKEPNTCKRILAIRDNLEGMKAALQSQQGSVQPINTDKTSVQKPQENEHRRLDIELIAKKMADRIGHGMSEKCLVHAEVAYEDALRQQPSVNQQMLAVCKYIKSQLAEALLDRKEPATVKLSAAYTRKLVREIEQAITNAESSKPDPRISQLEAENKRTQSRLADAEALIEELDRQLLCGRPEVALAKIQAFNANKPKE